MEIIKYDENEKQQILLTKDELDQLIVESQRSNQLNYRPLIPMVQRDSIYSSHRAIRPQRGDIDSLKVFLVLCLGSLTLASIFAYIGTSMEYRHRERMELYRSL